MSQVAYTEEKLLELGRDNYHRLVSFCKELERNGFWNQAKSVMKKSSTEVLALYVQSVLMNLAVRCENILENEMTYIRSVADSNPLQVPEHGEISGEIRTQSRRMYELPPVLLQLCGLYDKQNSKDMTEYFLDSLLNILVCMAYLNEGRDKRINHFIQEYYEKISSFVENRSQAENDAYIVKKLSSEEIECHVEWLQNKKKRYSEGTVQVAYTGKKARKSDVIKGVSDKTKNSTVVKDVSEKIEKPELQDTHLKDIKDASQSENVAENITKESELSDEELKRLRDEEESRLAREEFLKVKKRLQDREKAESEAHEQRIKELMDELDSMVGLEQVKEEIQSLINLIKIRQLREKMNMPLMDMSYHMVFTGSPGTGKTTVARLVGKIYKELGILSDGKMLETDRSGLVAGYVGQTAIKVHEIVEQALGGVLFIDEAYALVNPDVQNDFGVEAVDTLVKLMEDHRDNLVIIVAGYTEEMKEFLKSNTGLISRFNKFIDFPDYSKEQLIDIMEVMAGKAGMVVEDEARDGIMQILEKMSPEKWKDFGNARGIRNLFEKIVTNQANRLVELKEPTREQLMTITAQDVIM